MHDGSPSQLAISTPTNVQTITQSKRPLGPPRTTDTPTMDIDTGTNEYADDRLPNVDGPMQIKRIRANSIPTRTSSDGRNLRYSLRVVPPKRTSTAEIQRGSKIEAVDLETVPDLHPMSQLKRHTEQKAHDSRDRRQIDVPNPFVTVSDASTAAKETPVKVAPQIDEGRRLSLVNNHPSLRLHERKTNPPIKTNREARRTNTYGQLSSQIINAGSSESDVTPSLKLDRAGPALPTPISRRQGSSVKPSEIRCSSPVPSLNTNAENRENKGWPQYSRGVSEECAITDAPASKLTIRPSKQEYKDLGSQKVQAETASASSLDSKEVLLLKRYKQSDPAFSKVILNLENLLQEAITLAGEAVSNDRNTEMPKRQSTGPRKGETYSPEVVEESDPATSQSDTLQDVSSRRPLVPNSRVRLQEPENHVGNVGPKKHRDATPYPAQSIVATRHQSTVPPLMDGKMMDEVSKTPTEGLKSISSTPRQSDGSIKATFGPPSVKTNDWAYVHKSSKSAPLPPPSPLQPLPVRKSLRDDQYLLARNEGLRGQQRAPAMQRRSGSLHTDEMHLPQKEELNLPGYGSPSSDSEGGPYFADFKESAQQYHPVYRDLSLGEGGNIVPSPTTRRPFHEVSDKPIEDKEILQEATSLNDDHAHSGATLTDRHHFSIREPRGFSLSRSHRRKPIARDWSEGRKRFVATVTCITTALLGLVLGIYAGEVPAIQYTLADEHHYTILGNVVLFIGLAASTISFWPLPVLHGRKTYTTAALVILLPLQFPQALAVNSPRSPYVATYRTAVLLPRAISGFAMGFANINFMTTLLDLFGASLQSRNPHQEVVNENDVRRHGGGVGAWLGIWTWCSIMSIGVGFLIGASIISSDSTTSSVSWGFWIIIILTATVLFLNIIVPEVRRSPYRRSMAEVRTGTDISRRIARGEIKMHLDSTGPKHWYEELQAGHRLCMRMLKQPGFLVLALYQGWIYGQIVLIIALLGALLSKYYHFRPQFVGLGVFSIPLGALLAVPFQKANVLSRSRHHKQRTDSMTFEKRVTWTSHLVRRSTFTIILPFAGLGYTLTSDGTVHFMAPIIFAALIGFLSNLAIAECNGLIMETFDTSDLQPGMTGRPRRVLPEEIRQKRTNFSCFPRVTAGFAIAQTFSFLIAAGATGWGGVIERHLGAQVATAIVAGVLLILTLLLFAVLWRFKVVQVIPSERYGTNILSGPEDEWKPIIIGNPSGTTRRLNVLELGKMSRWTEIRRRNRLGSI